MVHAMTTINETPGVQGGEPCLAGTRTPVRSIVISYWDLHRQNMTKTQASFPHLTLEQIAVALEYYQDHKVRMDALIEDQDAALRELEARG